MNLNVALTLFSMGLLVAAAACGGGASPSPGAPVGEVIQIRDRLALDAEDDDMRVEIGMPPDVLTDVLPDVRVGR